MDLWEKSVVIAGKLETLSRADLEIILRGHGVVRTLTKPSRATSHLFCDDASGKLAAQARALGMEVVAERDLRSAGSWLRSSTARSSRHVRDPRRLRHA